MTSFSSTQSLKKSLFKPIFDFLDYSQLMCKLIQLRLTRAIQFSSWPYGMPQPASSSPPSLSSPFWLSVFFLGSCLNPCLPLLQTFVMKVIQILSACVFLWMYVPIMLKLQPYSFLWYIVYWKGQMVRTKWNKYCIIYIHEYLGIFSEILIVSSHPLPLGYVTGTC